MPAEDFGGTAPARFAKKSTESGGKTHGLRYEAIISWRADEFFRIRRQDKRHLVGLHAAWIFLHGAAWQFCVD